MNGLSTTADTAPPAEPETHASDLGQDQGGSPPVETIGEGGDQGSQGEQEQTQETQGQGASPEPEAQPGESVSQEELNQLRQEVAARDEILQQLNREMDRDPALRERLSRMGGGSQVDSAVSLEHELREVLKPDAAEALSKVLAPRFQRLEAENARLRSLVPTVQRLDQSVGSREFTAALAAKGVPEAVQGTKAFQAFAASLKSHPDYKAVMSSGNQRLAGSVLGDAWLASRAKSGSWSADQSRMAGARNGANGNGAARPGQNGAPQRSGSLAQQVVRIVRRANDPSYAVDQAHQVRMKAQQAGKPLPDIEFINAPVK